VLVIHGKGMHSEGEPVLGRTARRVIEASPWTGGYGPAERSQGGSGALWVAVKRGSNRGSG
jgi:DNA-nicking Smr family endonuclease